MNIHLGYTYINQFIDYYLKYFGMNLHLVRQTDIRIICNIYISKKICELSVRYSGPKLWNALPDQIKCAKSLNEKFIIFSYLVARDIHILTKL